MASRRPRINPTANLSFARNRSTVKSGPSDIVDKNASDEHEATAISVRSDLPGTGEKLIYSSEVNITCNLNEVHDTTRIDSKVPAMVAQTNGNTPATNMYSNDTESLKTKGTEENQDSCDRASSSHDNEDVASKLMPTSSVTAENDVIQGTNSTSIENTRSNISMSTTSVKSKVRPIGVHDSVEKVSECLGQQTTAENVFALPKVPSLKLTKSRSEFIKPRSISKTNVDERSRVKLCPFGLSACFPDPFVKALMSGEIPVDDSSKRKQKAVRRNRVPTTGPYSKTSKKRSDLLNFYNTIIMKSKSQIMDVPSRPVSESSSDSVVTSENTSLNDLTSVVSHVPTDLSDDVSDGTRPSCSVESSEDVNDLSAERTTTGKRKLTKKKKSIMEGIATKLQNGEMDRSRFTMADLIHYNPPSKNMKLVAECSGTPTAEPRSISSERLVAECSGTPTAEPLSISFDRGAQFSEKSVDMAEPQSDEELTSPALIPQVKVGPNGEIIFDEQRFVLKSTGTKKRKNYKQNKELAVKDVNGSNTFNKCGKQGKRGYWNQNETSRFFEALRAVGIDFHAMAILFPKFSRVQLKNKLNKEDKLNKERVDEALNNPSTVDLETLRKKFEMERETENAVHTTEPRKRCRRGTSFASIFDSTDRGKNRTKVRRPNIKKTNEKKTRKRWVIGTVDDTITDTESEPEVVLDNDANIEELHNQEMAPEMPQTTMGYHCGETVSEKSASTTVVINTEQLDENSVSEAFDGHAVKSCHIQEPSIFDEFLSDNSNDVYDSKASVASGNDTCHKDSMGEASKIGIVHDQFQSDQRSESCGKNSNTNNGKEYHDQYNFIITHDGLIVNEFGEVMGEVNFNEASETC